MINFRTRFIDELNVNNIQGHTNKFDDDSYVGLLLRVKFDNTAGSNVDAADVGRIRVNFRGDDIVNATWDHLRIYMDLKHGRPENPAAGATWNGGIFIPFYHPLLPSAIHKRRGDNLDFYMGASTAMNVSAVVQVYGVLDEVPEWYVAKLIDYQETATTGQLKIFIEQDNIMQVLVYKPETTPQTLLQLLVDNELIHSMDWFNATNLTNIIARIEAAALDVVDFDLVSKGQINETLSDLVVLLSTGGVGDFDYMTQSAVFNPNITVATAKVVRDDFSNKLIKKTNTGKIAGSLVTDMHDPGELIDANARSIIRTRPELGSVKKEARVPLRRTDMTSTVK